MPGRTNSKLRSRSPVSSLQEERGSGRRLKQNKLPRSETTKTDTFAMKTLPLLKTVPRRCERATFRSIVGLGIILTTLLAPHAFGQTPATENSWTKPSSGYWEEQAYWSLGVLPDATQDVLFNNAGSKALAIGAQTSQNFPQSMSVQSLRVGAPVDSYNVLLMNFSGFERPLQTGSLTVEANGAVLMQSSSLHVLQGGLPYEADLFILGDVRQTDFSQVNVDGRLRLDSG